MGFYIYVRITNGPTLKFTVNNYNVVDGFVIFYDQRQKVEKRYDGRICEITKYDDGDAV